MKSKIKKRVDGNNRKNVTGVVFVTFIIFVLVVGVVFVFLNREMLFNKFKNNNKVNDKVLVDDNKNEDSNNIKYKYIDINSPYVEHLFNLVHAKVTGGDSTIYKNSSLSVSEMDSFYKFSLASNLYDGLAFRNNYAQINEVTAYLTEENVKKSYEFIFGLNTYKRSDTIPYTCTNMYFDTVSRNYITTNQVCGSISPFTSYEKVICAKKSNDELLITGAVVFAAGYDGSLCKDYECTTVIDSFASNETNNEYFYGYIEKNKDRLMQYTYKFKLNDDGFYYYQGFERTKE